MSEIKIVLDSSSDLTELAGIACAIAPLKIKTADKEYVDNAELDVEAMINEMYSYKGRSATSCPNVEDWISAFGDACRIFCITITSNLSGSYNSARMAKMRYEEQYPDRRVELIDSLSTGPEIGLMAELIRSLAAEGKDFDDICAEIKVYKTELLFVLESMKNLANNGRISKLAATAAGLLGIRAVGRASDSGTPEMLGKCRGAQKIVGAVLEYMRRYGYRGGRVKISHALNPQLANDLLVAIRGEFPGAAVDISPCRALCSFYAEKGGILVGYEV